MKRVKLIATAVVLLGAIGLGWRAQTLKGLPGEAPVKGGGFGMLQNEAEYVGPEKCLTCHGSMQSSWDKNKHKSLMDMSEPKLKACEACHGPGGVHVQEPATPGSITNPSKASKKELTEICGKCHQSKEGPASAPKMSQDMWKFSTHFRKGIECTNCHNMHGGEDNGSLLNSSKEELCVKCHSNMIDGPYTHTPVKQKMCVDCHNPHGESAPHMVRSDVKDTCMKCHDVTTAEAVKSHGGYNVAGKNCAECHDPHAKSKDKKLIKDKQHPPFKNRTCTICHNAPTDANPLGFKKDATEICTGCHGDKASVFDKMPVAHFPVPERMCTACHNPHASKQDKFLNDKPMLMCVKCHKDVNVQLSGDNQHPPVATGNCGLCHGPHGQSNEKLLNEQPDDLCRKCHQNIKFSHPLTLNTKNPAKGEYVRCYTCHAVHGSDYPKLLPTDETTMCNGCHRKDTMDGMKVRTPDQEKDEMMENSR